MLLLAGFVISATAIVAIGAYTALQSGDTQVAERSNRPIVDLFLNTRQRAIDFFGLVTANDTAISVEQNLDSYLFAQYQTARSMSLQLNASLAGNGTDSPKNEYDHFLVDHDGDNTFEYANLRGNKLWAQSGRACFGGTAYDGTGDGLITDSDGTVLGAIFWLEIEGVDTTMEEYIAIDVESTDPSTAC